MVVRLQGRYKLTTFWVEKKEKSYVPRELDDQLRTGADKGNPTV